VFEARPRGGTLSTCWNHRNKLYTPQQFFIIFVDAIFTILFERPFTNVFDVNAQSATNTCLYRARNAD
jgi:hypothetical protein